jgi:hypothetical protein
MQRSFVPQDDNAVVIICCATPLLSILSQSAGLFPAPFFIIIFMKKILAYEANELALMQHKIAETDFILI